jgi:hypothetical protein
MVAAVGAVVLARRRRGLEAVSGERLEFRVSTAPPALTGTMAEAAGVRVPRPQDMEPEVEVIGRRREGGW